MRLSATPESLTERLALAAGRIPVPLIQTFQASLLARAIMVATRIDLFEALERGPLTREALAQRCGCHVQGLGHLLEALVGSGYIERHPRGYALGSTARTWLLSSSPRSVRDKVLFQFVEMRALEGFEAYVRSGTPSPMHAQMQGEDWGDYQRAMHGFAQHRAPEVVAKTPVPQRARAMLDIGGGHGAISAAFCRSFPDLHATVLDLPEAVGAAAPLLAREGLGARLTHRPDDARSADLGEKCWDIVYIGQLTHHLDEAANRSLVARSARSLRPSGILVICDALPGEPSQVSALADLFGAVASGSAAWGPNAMRSWISEVGLTYSQISLGGGLQALFVGTKSR